MKEMVTFEMHCKYVMTYELKQFYNVSVNCLSGAYSR